MTAFVVLAAGRGSRLGRIGDELPKCLVPLDGFAVLSRQLALMPPGARPIVVVGYRAEQVEEYVRLAHPDLDVTVVRDPRWGAGPGASLLVARDVVGDDHMVFTACDTLWEPDWSLWTANASWLAVAPLPAGTPAARWCRVVPDRFDPRYVGTIHDKTPDVVPDALVSTAFGCVLRDDLPTFWAALEDADTVVGEVQLSTGLRAIIDGGDPLELRHVRWLDVGDDDAYRAARAAYTGYDPLKPGQVTYVLPEVGRVIKWHADRTRTWARVERAKFIGDAVPTPLDPVAANPTMVGFDYVPGTSVYRYAELHAPDAVVTPLLDWWTARFWATRHDLTDGPPPMCHPTTLKFYRDKTFARVMSLDPALRASALDAITRVDWDALVDGVVPGTFHGDLTYANVVVSSNDDGGVTFTGIDWREDFAGIVEWGDLRYDVAKLLSGTAIHWENAARGDLRRWPLGPSHADAIEAYARDRLGLDVDDLRRLAALCLINSAALHATPMDEILVARGCRWLGEVT